MKRNGANFRESAHTARVSGKLASQAPHSGYIVVWLENDNTRPPFGLIKGALRQNVAIPGSSLPHDPSIRFTAMVRRTSLCGHVKRTSLNGAPHLPPCNGTTLCTCATGTLNSSIAVGRGLLAK